MKRRTFLLGGASTAVGGSALLGSGALSETDSQRVVKIQVEDDDEAYLRLVSAPQSVECEETVVLVTLTNHLKAAVTDIDVSFTTINDDVTITGLIVPDSLAIGESREVTAEVSCESETPTTTTVVFDVTVRNDDLEVTAQNREIGISCSCPPSGDDENGEGGEGSDDENGGGQNGTGGGDEGGAGGGGGDGGNKGGGGGGGGDGGNKGGGGGGGDGRDDSGGGGDGDEPDETDDTNA